MNAIITWVKENKWLLLILLVATFLRFYKLDFQSLWMDEIYTMNISSPKLSLSEFHSEMLLREGFPYLYYILLKITYVFFGYSPFVARGFSVVAGVLCVYAIYRLAKELSNTKVGLLSALLLAVNEYHIFISQDARLYTLYFLATVFSFYRLILFLKDRSYRNTIWYGISAGLLISVNFFGFVNLFSHVVIVLFFIALCPKQDQKDFLIKSVVSALIALVLFAPNYDMLIKLLNFQSFWVPAPTEESFSLLFKEFLGNSELTLFIFSPVFVYYLIKIFSKKADFNLESILTIKPNFGFVIYFGWSFLFIYFLMVKSYGDVSLILTRYFTSIQPVLILVLATGIGYIRNRIVRSVLVLSVVVLSLTNLVVVKDFYGRVAKAQFREASNFVIANNTKKEPVLTSQKYWFDYYFLTDEVNIPLQESELETVIQQMIQDPTKIKPFWFVDAFGKTYALSEASQNFVNNTFYIENNYDGFQAWAKHFTLLKDMPTSVDISKFGALNQQNGDAMMYNLEVFENDNRTVKASGWAYFDKQEATKSELAVLMIKDGKATRMIAQKVNRPDVTSYFKSEFNVDASGFAATYDLSKLEPGSYQIGIYLVNKETQKEGLVITDKTIQK